MSKSELQMFKGSGITLRNSKKKGITKAIRSLENRVIFSKRD